MINVPTPCRPRPIVVGDHAGITGRAWPSRAPRRGRRVRRTRSRTPRRATARARGRSSSAEPPVTGCVPTTPSIGAWPPLATQSDHSSDGNAVIRTDRRLGALGRGCNCASWNAQIIHFCAWIFDRVGSPHRPDEALVISVRPSGAFERVFQGGTYAGLGQVRECPPGRGGVEGQVEGVHGQRGAGLAG